MLSPTIFFTCHPLLCLAPFSNFFLRHPHTVSYIIYLLSRRDFRTHSYLTKDIWVFASLSFSISLPQIKKQKIYEAFFNVSDTRAGAISVASSWKERVKKAWKHFFKFLWCYIYTFFQSHKTRQITRLFCVDSKKNISETEYQQNKIQFKWRKKTMWEDFWNNYCCNWNQIEKSR